MEGKVYLIGAGPGAADLITLRGLNILRRADIVFYDALVEPEVLDHCRATTRRIHVGKCSGRCETEQVRINKYLVDAAREHGIVVRLKGGDPMIFGRAYEEIEELKVAQIEFEVVPGVTSALAAAANLKTSLTYRGISRSVVFCTSARARDSSQLPAPMGDTMVYYMGRADAMKIAHRLLEDGKDGETPVWVMEAITTSRERRLFTNLLRLAQGEAESWFDGSEPITLLIGKALSPELQ